MYKKLSVCLIVILYIAIYCGIHYPLSRNTAFAASYLVSQGQPATAGTVGTGTPVSAGNDGALSIPGGAPVQSVIRSGGGLI